jgi:hypothetical protein
MNTASEAYSSEQALADREFEELLQRTWELVNSQKENHLDDCAAETPSWT